MTLINRLLAHEAAGGVVLMLATFAALVVANSPLLPVYQAVLDAPLSITLATRANWRRPKRQRSPASARHHPQPHGPAIG